MRAELVKMLRCLDDGSELHEADAGLIERVNRAAAGKQLRERGGDVVDQPLTGGLVRADGRLLYPVSDGFPTMLLDKAIPLDGLGE